MQKRHARDGWSKEALKAWDQLERKARQKTADELRVLPPPRIEPRISPPSAWAGGCVRAGLDEAYPNRNLGTRNRRA